MCYQLSYYLCYFMFQGQQQFGMQDTSGGAGPGNKHNAAHMGASPYPHHNPKLSPRGTMHAPGFAQPRPGFPGPNTAGSSPLMSPVGNPEGFPQGGPFPSAVQFGQNKQFSQQEMMSGHPSPTVGMGGRMPGPGLGQNQSHFPGGPHSGRLPHPHPDVHLNPSAVRGGVPFSSSHNLPHSAAGNIPYSMASGTHGGSGPQQAGAKLPMSSPTALPSSSALFHSMAAANHQNAFSMASRGPAPSSGHMTLKDNSGVPELPGDMSLPKDLQNINPTNMSDQELADIATSLAEDAAGSLAEDLLAQFVHGHGNDPKVESSGQVLPNISSAGGVGMFARDKSSLSQALFSGSTAVSGAGNSIQTSSGGNSHTPHSSTPQDIRSSGNAAASVDFPAHRDSIQSRLMGSLPPNSSSSSSSSAVIKHEVIRKPHSPKLSIDMCGEEIITLCKGLGKEHRILIHINALFCGIMQDFKQF